MKTKSLLNWKAQLAFGSAILTLLAVGAISYRSMVASTESDRWVRHTHEVLEKLQNSLAAMRSAGVFERGYKWNQTPAVARTKRVQGQRNRIGHLKEGSLVG